MTAMINCDRLDLRGEDAERFCKNCALAFLEHREDTLLQRIYCRDLLLPLLLLYLRWALMHHRNLRDFTLEQAGLKKMPVLSSLIRHRSELEAKTMRGPMESPSSTEGWCDLHQFNDFKNINQKNNVITCFYAPVGHYS